MVKRYQKEMDEAAAKQAHDNAIWNEAIEVVAKLADEYWGDDAVTLIRALKREPKP